MGNILKEIDSVFAVAEEMVSNCGEDSYCYEAVGQAFLIAAFDGCGGSGSKKYENYSGKTGAYIASRAVCGGIERWFRESRKESEIKKYIGAALSVCEQYADKGSRILGSLGKSFPTTAAIISGQVESETVKADCFWAGDSRCYLLDEDGLHQLTEDDLDGQDAMSNLQNDGVMTNVINGSVGFVIHQKTMYINHPCILLTATDGCFGYLKSPMEFEYLLLDTLLHAKSLREWKTLLRDRMGQISGDDYTLCAAVFGFGNFPGIQDAFRNRVGYLKKHYIQSKTDLELLWNVYREEYSKYI